ncbi:MAG: hypothetical protein IJG39_10265 [Synergistaceae bacterium]|nr:hypothetical protein [Synergistaceae bacterium]
MLRKCRYCGGKGSVRPYVFDGEEVGKYAPYYAMCEECGAHTGVVSNAEIASEEWNMGAVIMSGRRLKDD